MGVYVITGSVTYALQGRDLLKRAGIKAEIKRQPSGLDRVGCGYGIITDKQAVPLLKSGGIKIMEIRDI